MWVRRNYRPLFLGDKDVYVPISLTLYKDTYIYIALTTYII